MTLRKITAVLTLLALYLLANCTAERNGRVTLRLTSPDSVSSTAHVPIRLTFYNRTSGMVGIYHWKVRETITPAISRWLRFSITSENGQHLVYSYGGPIPKMPHEDDVYTIEPGADYEEVVNLVTYYVDSLRLHEAAETAQTLHTWLPGRYRISCTYEYIHNPKWLGGRDLWEGTAVSDTIEIIVRD